MPILLSAIGRSPQLFNNGSATDNDKANVYGTRYWIIQGRQQLIRFVLCWKRWFIEKGSIWCGPMCVCNKIHRFDYLCPTIAGGRSRCLFQKEIIQFLTWFMKSIFLCRPQKHRKINTLTMYCRFSVLFAL